MRDISKPSEEPISAAEWAAELAAVQAELDAKRAEKAAGKNVLMVIAPKNFRDEEYAQPHAAFVLAGFNVETTCLMRGTCHGTLGSTVEVELQLKDAVERDDWDAVVFVGGSGAELYVDNPLAHRLVKDTVERGKLLAAICLAPKILASAGVLDGVEATSYPDYWDYLAAVGNAKLSKDAVVESKNTVNGAPIVTANGPEAAFAFGQTVVNLLRDPFEAFLNR